MGGPSLEKAIPGDDINKKEIPEKIELKKLSADNENTIFNLVVNEQKEEAKA